MGLEPTITTSERAKTVHGLYRAATVIGEGFLSHLNDYETIRCSCSIEVREAYRKKCVTSGFLCCINIMILGVKRALSEGVSCSIQVVMYTVFIYKGGMFYRMDTKILGSLLSYLIHI